MTLLTRIKADQVALRLAGTDMDKLEARFLTTLLGELENDAKSGKEATDEVIVAKIKKVISNNNDTIKLLIQVEPAANLFRTENKRMERYLPQQLTELELSNIIVLLEAKNIGQVMGHLKSLYAGRYDGKLASKVAREYISNV